MTPPSPEIRAVLLLLEGYEVGRKFVLQAEEISVGTAGQISIEAPDVAPVHAVIFRRGYNFSIRQARSDFPVLINGISIVEETLQSMDEIELGRARLLFSLSEQLPGDELEEFGSPVAGDGDEFDQEVAPEPREYKTRKMDQDPRRGRDTVGGLSRPSPRQIRIKMLQGEEEQEYQFLTIRLVIGRTIGDLIIADPDMSRKHCSIEVMGDSRIYLHDHASTNGTFLNGHRITYSLLKSGDRVSLGNTVFKVYFQLSD